MLPACPQGWRGWVCYNDAPPSFRPGSRFGHCKGILAWRTDRLGWLVHSVPEWPEVLSDRGVTALPKSAVKNGQSFVWLSLPRSDALTKAICSELLRNWGVLHDVQLLYCAVPPATHLEPPVCAASPIHCPLHAPSLSSLGTDVLTTGSCRSVLA